MGISIQTLYVLVVSSIEIVAFCILIAMALTVPLDPGDYYPPSISSGLSSSMSMTIYYVVIVYIFAIEKNYYEFILDPHERNTAIVYIRYLIYTRIIFMNILMILLALIASVTNVRDPHSHNVVALLCVIVHLVFEVINIIIRSISFYYDPENLAIRITALVFEALLVISAILFALCFIDVFDGCPSSSVISSVSEYMLFFIIIATSIFRTLDDKNYVYKNKIYEISLRSF